MQASTSCVAADAGSMRLAARSQQHGYNVSRRSDGHNSVRPVPAARPLRPRPGRSCAGGLTVRAALNPAELGQLLQNGREALVPALNSLDHASVGGLAQQLISNAQLGFAEGLDPTVLLQVQQAVQEFGNQYTATGIDPSELAAAGGGILGASAGTKNSPFNKLTPPTTYDIPLIRAYWKQRPLAANKRSSRLLAKLVSWGSKVVLDVQAGSVDKNAPKRAAELRQLITDQGPAFVKVGQAVAIRPDILPEPYLVEFQTLLENVQPFSSEEAKELLVQELGAPLGELFTNSGDFDKSVAAASIGQVYKATLKGKGPNGEDVPVAVKCQRPDILENVSLDLLTLRDFTEFFCNLKGESDTIKQIRQNSQGFLAVLDVAAERFLEELDYKQEAQNGAQFEEEMNAVEVVRGVIKVPKVFNEYSTRFVLVQEWVEGVKLTELKEDDSENGKRLRGDVVRKLLNAYMVQFLETGFLHADPHPGNFMLMPDGRLCIMDYGMMTNIEYEQRVAFVEYLAHLSSGQWERTLDDLVALGFVPAELGEDPEKRAIVGPVLAETLEALYSTGGGADVKLELLQEQATSRVGEIKDKLDELAKEYPISLPPYFVLILRAFGTLEGLGLGVEKDFAIVDECFPYIARRMLSDDSPRMRAALKTFIYGKSDRLDLARVEDLAKGFRSFTNSMDASVTTTALVKPADVKQDGGLDAATRDLLALLFAPGGNYLQELVVEEAVRAVDALSRDATVRVWRALGQSAPAAAATSLIPLAPFAPPTIFIPGLNTLPLLSLFASSQIDTIALSEEDRKNLAVIEKLAALMQEASAQSSQDVMASFFDAQGRPTQLNQQSFDQAADIARTVLPGAQRMLQQFSAQLTDRFRLRFEEDVRALGFPLGAR